MSHDINTLAATYIKLRDAKAAMVKKQKEELAPIQEAMNKIEAWCLNDLQNVQRATSVACKGVGTVYLSTLTKPKVEDATTFLDFLKANDALHMLDLKPNVTAVEEFLEATGSPPPGISIRRETFARIRK